MNKWFADVWARTIPDRDRDLLPAVGFLGLICMVFSAFFFAAHDYGKVNVLLAFIVGFFTGGVWLVLTFGSILLFIFFISLFVQMSSQRILRQLENKNPLVLIIYGATALIIVVAIWAAVFDAVTRLPILGDQVTFMFRDSGD